MAFGGSNYMQEMMLDTAKKQLKDYMDGVRKTKPAKKYLDVLEDSGIISKLNGGKMSKTDKKIRDADAWTDFAGRTGRKGVDLAKYAGGRKRPPPPPPESISSTGPKSTHPTSGRGGWVGLQGGSWSLNGQNGRSFTWILFSTDYIHDHSARSPHALDHRPPTHLRHRVGWGFGNKQGNKTERAQFALGAKLELELKSRGLALCLCHRDFALSASFVGAKQRAFLRRKRKRRLQSGWNGR
jgi:hypothetical protein